MNQRQFHHLNRDFYIHNQTSTKSERRNKLYPDLINDLHCSKKYCYDSDRQININSKRTNIYHSNTDYSNNLQISNRSLGENRDSKMRFSNTNAYAHNQALTARKYSFFWNSSMIPLSQGGNEMWTSYQEEIQDFLNIKYLEYIKGIYIAPIRLIHPLENYTIDFKSQIEYPTTNINRKRQIKVEELNNEIEYIFAWESKNEKLQKALNKQGDSFIEYPSKIQVYLNLKYKEFLHQGISQFVNLEHPYQDHLVDLQAGLLYSLTDRLFKRRIKIETRNKIKNYRQDESETYSPQQNGSEVYYEENIIANQYSQYTDECYDEYLERDESDSDANKNSQNNNQTNFNYHSNNPKTSENILYKTDTTKSINYYRDNTLNTLGMNKQTFHNESFAQENSSESTANENQTPSSDSSKRGGQNFSDISNSNGEKIVNEGTIKPEKGPEDQIRQSESQPPEIPEGRNFNNTESDLDVDNCLDIPQSANTGKLLMNNERKFILGKCNPVLVIPGFMATRLISRINCPSLVKDLDKLYELRYFCGKSICKESLMGEYEVEEYTIWPVLFNSPFRLFQDSDNKDNSCFAYFMRHYNEENDCPTDSDTNKNLCLYNKNIKITYFGDTPSTADKSECGTKGINRIISGGYSMIPESLINSSGANGYYETIKSLEKKGYSVGFSVAGLPYDYRKFYLNNENFKENFQKMVEMLYRNTGKKVIVIAHSYGNLGTLTILNTDNPINAKIKRYIALTPAYLGCLRMVMNLSFGSEEFRTELIMNRKIDISPQSQRFFLLYMPSAHANNPKPTLHLLSTMEKYKNYIEALKERFDLEKNCGILAKDFNKVCTFEYIQEHSKKFKAIFPFFPQFDSPICFDLRAKILYSFQNQEFLNFKIENRKNILEYIPSYVGCELRIFDYLRCPLIKILNQENLQINDINNNTNTFTLEDFHNQCFEDSDKVDREDLIFNHDCKVKGDKKNCLNDYFKNFTTFDVKKIFEKRSTEFFHIPKSVHTDGTDYYRMFDIANKKIQDSERLNILDKPKVPTSVIYGSHIDTQSNLIFDNVNKNTLFNETTVNFFGGDGTISTYSMLILPMKWIYDNKIERNKSDIQIVNYCSYLSDYPEFAFNFTSKNSATEKEYVALKCDCMTNKGYDLQKISSKLDKCSHSSFYSDINVIKYIFSMASNEPVYDNLEDYPKNIIRASTNAVGLNYQDICNQILHDFD